MSTMQTFHGTIAYINPPKEGKKKGSVKLEDGNYIGMWPNQLDQFSQGQAVTLLCESNEFQGKTYWNYKPSTNGQAQTQTGTQGGAFTPAGMLAARANIAAACITSGLSMETFREWWTLVKEDKRPAPPPSDYTPQGEEIPF